MSNHPGRPGPRTFGTKPHGDVYGREDTGTDDPAQDETSSSAGLNKNLADQLLEKTRCFRQA